MAQEMDLDSTQQLKVSVVIATYNRADSLMQLLQQLSLQTLPSADFEVIVSDDGSVIPVAGRLRDVTVPFALTVLTQKNAGPATARHNAIVRARGALLVIVDDDMRIERSFLAEHVAAHATDTFRVVLGRLRSTEEERLPLFERWHMALAEKLEARVRAGRTQLRGTYMYTGNVSFRKADYVAVGGFDLAFRISEDAELGVRFDSAGAKFVFCEGAIARHASDHTKLATWMARATRYGIADSLVSEKHSECDWANPWRVMYVMSSAIRPLLMASVLAPVVMRPVSWLAMRMALLFDALHLERVAFAGTSLVYGMQYFLGARAHAGSLGGAMRGIRRYRAGLGLEQVSRDI